VRVIPKKPHVWRCQSMWAVSMPYQLFDGPCFATWDWRLAIEIAIEAANTAANQPVMYDLGTVIVGDAEAPCQS
jgi:hypothetical protein